MKFEERLKFLRRERGLKQIELCGALGVSPQNYSMYEMGREPKYEVLADLSKYFDCSTDYLLGLSEARHLSESEKDAQIIAMKEKIARLEATIKEIAAICNANPQEV